MCPHSAVLSTPMDDLNATYDKQSVAMAQSSAESHFYYLDEDSRKNLLKYQYKGSDNSLLYQYVLSPFALFCVEKYVPESIAPNTITFFGLCWMITSYSICWYFVPTLETTNEIPSWVFLWNAVSLLAYQTLDNMDGKQARKTGSSSPLGLLFDHGCDAINSIFGSANWIIAMGLTLEQDSFAATVLIFIPFVLFYVATWEEYHVGELVLPIFNGPSEGLFMGAALHLTTFFKGTSFWHTTGLYDNIKSFLPFDIPFDHQPLRNIDFIVIFTLLGGLQEIALKTTQVNKKHPGSLSGLVPFAVFASGFILMGLNDINVWLSIPRTGLHLAMVIFVEMTTDLMLAHMTNQKYEWLRWQQLPLVLLTFALYLDVDADLIKYWISAYAWSLGSYVVMKMVLVIQECCTVLNIWCFDITTPRTPKVSATEKAN